MRPLRLSLVLAISLIGTDSPAVASAEVITKEHICKAGIAKIMGRDPKTMQILKNEAGVIHLQYVRKNDGSLWAYRCRVEGSQIVWASDSGRWRDHPLDEKITYAVAGDVVTVKETFTNGDSTQGRFKKSQLK